MINVVFIRKLTNQSHPDSDIQRLLKRISGVPNMKSGSIRLVILLGLLGDLDSFEYIQSIRKILPDLESSNINLYVIGIGNSESKIRFSKFNNLPLKYLDIEEDSSLHDDLNLSPGLVNSYSSLMNMILMKLKKL